MKLPKFTGAQKALIAAGRDADLLIEMGLWDAT